MTRTFLALALLITILVGNAYGEDEVFYCAETNSNGFKFDKELKKYKPQLFFANKFKIKLDRTAKTIEMKGYPVETTNGTFTCSSPFTLTSPQHLLACRISIYLTLILAMESLNFSRDLDTLGQARTRWL